MKRRDFVKLSAGGALAATLPIGCQTPLPTRPVGGSVVLPGLKMQPFSTSLVAVVKGALDFHGHSYTTPMIFGASGHAFTINIHKQLCPSSPYCWKMDGFYRLCKLMGVNIIDLGFSSHDENSTPGDRLRIEGQLRAALARHQPCAMCNLDNQLITGFDETGIFAAQPWGPNCKTTPPRLTYGSWNEFGKLFHVNFFILRNTEPVEKRLLVRASLRYAVDAHENGAKYSRQEYAVGREAYDFWISAAENYGSSHGNWWNSRVWGECRRMAAKYFTQIGKDYPAAAKDASRLANTYQLIATDLQKVGNKKLNAQEKIGTLKIIQARETTAMNQIRTLIDLI